MSENIGSRLATIFLNVNNFHQNNPLASATKPFSKVQQTLNAVAIGLKAELDLCHTFAAVVLGPAVMHGYCIQCCVHKLWLIGLKIYST